MLPDSTNEKGTRWDVPPSAVASGAGLYSRRQVLIGASVLGLGLAALSTVGVAASQAAGADSYGTFMKVSATLTGVADLAPDLGRVIHDHLLALDGATPAVLDLLQTALAASPQGRLPADADARVRTLAAAINTAWYLGVVGSGDKSLCVAYEHALNYRPLADVCVLPTYAHGEPHYWAQPPRLASAGGQA